MIQESRTLPELEALESPLTVWRQHPLYEQLTSLFAARVREFAVTPGKELHPAPKTLTIPEGRRLTKRMLRATSIAELDSLVDRLRLRYTAGNRRDEVENFARVRRERLARITSSVEDVERRASATEKHR
jgi:hypothetical protein